MARSRNIKPGFFKNEQLGKLSPLARILFAGLWTLADREGRMEDRPLRIKAEVLPYDKCNPEKLLTELQDSRFIYRYEVAGAKFISIPTWLKHQKPHHMELPSAFPPPPGNKNAYNHEPVRREQRERIIARDGARCVLCESIEEPLHIDHIVHVSKGGTSDDDNLRTLCKTCNLSRGNREDASISARIRNVNTLISTQDRFDENGSCPTSFLIPDSSNLIPDSMTHDRSLLEAYEQRLLPAWGEDKRDVDLGAQQWISLIDNDFIADVDVVLEGLERWKASEQWQKNGGQFKPSIAKWLAQKRWRDFPRPANAGAGEDLWEKEFGDAKAN